MEKWGITLLRVATGLVFAMHGGQKLFMFGLGGTAGAFGQIGIPFPQLSAALVIAVELLGGIALMLGSFTRLAAIPAGFTMIVAMLAVHLKNGFFLPDGFEFTLILLAATASLVLTGPGALALDNLRRTNDSNSPFEGAGSRKPRVA